MTGHDFNQLASIFGKKGAQRVADNRNDYDDIDPYETEENWILRSIGAR